MVAVLLTSGLMGTLVPRACATPPMIAKPALNVSTDSVRSRSAAVTISAQTWFKAASRAFVETDAWDRAHAYVVVNVRMVFAYRRSVSPMTNATENSIAGMGTASS